MREPLTVKTLEDVRSELAEYWEPSRRAEDVPLADARGRILAEDVNSELDLPPFDRSTYDGFAVRAEDTFGAEENDPRTLRRKGRILAGQRSDEEVEEDQCMEISTGAPLPEGADAVVKVEDVTVSEGEVEVRRAVSPGENISERGSELEKGEKVASECQRLTPQVHGALSACGIGTLKVLVRPQVGIISTGEELVEAGSKIEPGQIYDVNGQAILDAAANCGADPTYLGIVDDDPATIKLEVRDALDDHDVVITSGGSSAGSSDIVPETVDGLGDPGIVAHGLAQKPGKPTFLAVVGDKPIFGLPGYPVSALMVFDQLVAPHLRKMSGEPESERERVRAKLARKVLSTRGRRELVPMSLKGKEDELSAFPLREGSGAITSLVKADGYTVIPLEKEIIEEDELVTVKLFGGAGLA